jgi:hypothetical protein
VLLSREISSPFGNVLKSSSLHRFVSTGCLPPGLTDSKAIPARELAKGRTHTAGPQRQRQHSVPLRKPVRNCVSKEV